MSHILSFSSIFYLSLHLFSCLSRNIHVLYITGITEDGPITATALFPEIYKSTEQCCYLLTAEVLAFDLFDKD